MPGDATAGRRRSRVAPYAMVLPAVVYLGVFPTAIAFTTFAYALRTMSASMCASAASLLAPDTARRSR